MSSSPTRSETMESPTKQQTISEYVTSTMRIAMRIQTTPPHLEKYIEPASNWFGNLTESLIFAMLQYFQKIKTVLEKGGPKTSESKTIFEPSTTEDRSPARAQSFDPEGELSGVMVCGAVALACAELDSITIVEDIRVLAVDWTVPKLEQVLLGVVIEKVEEKWRTKRRESKPIDAAPMVLAKSLGKWIMEIVTVCTTVRCRDYASSEKKMEEPTSKEDVSYIVRGFMYEFLTAFPGGAKYFQQTSAMPITADVPATAWAFQKSASLPVVKWMSTLAALVENPLSAPSIDSKPGSTVASAGV